MEKLDREKILVFYNKIIWLMTSIPGYIKKYKEISEGFGNSFLSVTFVWNHVTRKQTKM